MRIVATLTALLLLTACAGEVTTSGPPRAAPSSPAEKTTYDAGILDDPVEETVPPEPDFSTLAWGGVLPVVMEVRGAEGCVIRADADLGFRRRAVRRVEVTWLP